MSKDEFVDALTKEFQHDGELSDLLDWIRELKEYAARKTAEELIGLWAMLRR